MNLMIPAPKRETYEDDDDRVISCGGFRCVSKNCSAYPSFHLGCRDAWGDALGVYSGSVRVLVWVSIYLAETADTLGGMTHPISDVFFHLLCWGNV